MSESGAVSGSGRKRLSVREAWSMKSLSEKRADNGGHKIGYNVERYFFS